MHSENRVYRTDNQTKGTPKAETPKAVDQKPNGQAAEDPKNNVRTTGNQRPIYYLQAEFTVRRENHRAYQLLMTRLMSVIYDLFGWELVQASYPITGEVNRFTHIWRISNPDSILHVMRQGAFEFFGSDDLRVSETQKHEIPLRTYFKRIYREIQKVVEDTTHRLTTSLPHDPNSAGHQSQTLLIDVDGDIFIMEHEKMRKDWAEFDINADLMVARQLRNYDLWGPKHLEAKAQAQVQVQDSTSDLDLPSKKEAEAFQELAKKVDRIQADLRLGGKTVKKPEPEVATIQNLLNEGVTHARVVRKGEDALLINLSALKARPVLQQGFDISKHVLPKNNKSPALSNGDGMFNAFKRLLIATPWGSVYDVNAKEINDFAKQINSDNATVVRVAPIVQHRATLASVLEAPDDVIGDGCVCYVINLSSFCGEERFNSANTKLQDACTKFNERRTNAS